MQNVLDRLAKISKQQTKLSRTRKMDLSLKDDLDAALSKLQAAYSYAIDENLEGIIENVDQAVIDLDQAYSAWKQVSNAAEAVLEAADAFELAASDLGVEFDVNEFDNGLLGEVSESMSENISYLQSLESSSSDLKSLSAKWPTGPYL